ncbi:MAG TPA: hypothetical protein VMU31_01395 [Rhizomicrobium sp.]|nr:hypothetical protein [Rhizomicrobium sp.]
MAKKQNDSDVKVRITRLGAGKVSTGVHVAVEGEVMAEAGAILTVPEDVAEALEARGFAEVQ